MIIKLDGEQFKLKKGEWVSTSNYIGLFSEPVSTDARMMMIDVVYNIDTGLLTKSNECKKTIWVSDITHIGNKPFLKFLDDTKLVEPYSTGRNIADKEYSKNGITKPRIGLVPPLALTEVAKVFTYGADKYDDYNFSKGAPKTTYIDAALRHINKYNSMTDVDDESNLPHLAHAISCLMMLLDNDLNGTSIEDRNKYYE